MRPARQIIGERATPVLTVDGIGPDPSSIKAMAHELAPFPPAVNNYPGLRRVISESDGAAWAYVLDLLEQATPFIAGAFDLDGFDLVEASFSLVTQAPAVLTPVQRMPHFDSVESDFYAVMHYVADCAGTAFYRHRASGIEVIEPDTVDSYVAAARRAAATAPTEYICGNTDSYACIGTVEGLSGRLVAYPGRLLHSGIIPPGFSGSADPRQGRLTTNIFIRGH